MFKRPASSGSISVRLALSVCMLCGVAAHAAMPARAILATGTRMDTAAYAVTLHVKTTGSDASDGSSDANAVQTIGRAFALAKTRLSAGTGVKVLIQPGRYHEPTIRMDATTMTQAGKDALFVIEGAARGEVVISGSERAGWEASTWTKVYADSLVYTHPWDSAWFYDCGTLSPTSDGCIGWHREMVVFNAKVLRQVVSRTALAINTFYIDEAARTIRLKLGQAMSSADLIEIPNQKFLFRCSGKNKVVMKKLLFEHENSYIQSGLNDGDGWGVAVAFRTESGKTRDLLIEDCIFRANNSCALKLHQCDSVTIRRCVANNNGWKGIGFGQGTNILLEDNETSYNCWRQQWSHGTGWDAAGLKVISAVNKLTVRRHYADSNTTASGIWCDWNNTNVTIDSCTFNNHSFDALYIECTAGPTTITRCTIRRSPSGIFSYGTNNNIIEDCRFENVGGAFNLTVDPNRSPCRTNSNFYVRRCSINGSGQFFGGGDWTNFFNTLDIDSNQYSNRSGTASTQLFKNAAGTGVNFAQWQALGKDVHSTWVTAAAAQAPANRSSSRPLSLRAMAEGEGLVVSGVSGSGISLHAVDTRGRIIARSAVGDLRIPVARGVVFVQVRTAAGKRGTAVTIAAQ